MHAQLLATLYNAHFETKGVPWTAEHILGKADRKTAKEQSVRDLLATRRVTMAAFAKGELPTWVKELESNRKVAVN
jgi:hypothetical protein